MQFKRFYEMKSLATWKKASAEFIASHMAEIRRKNPDWGVKEATAYLKDKFIAMNGLPKISHLRVESQPRNGIWRFSEKALEQGQDDGYIERSRDSLTITTDPSQPDLHLKIIRRKGFYCVYCGQRLASSIEGAEHVQIEHADDALMERTPEGGIPEGATLYQIDQINNPAGWMKFNGYECIVADSPLPDPPHPLGRDLTASAG